MMRREPPHDTGSIGSPQARRAAKMSACCASWTWPFRQSSTGSRSGPRKYGGNTTHCSRSTCVNSMSRWIAVFSAGMTTTTTFAIVVWAKSIDARWSIAAGLERSLKPIITVSPRSGWTSPPSSV